MAVLLRADFEPAARSIFAVTSPKSTRGVRTLALPIRVEVYQTRAALASCGAWI